MIFLAYTRGVFITLYFPFGMIRTWSALNKLHNVRLLNKVIRSAGTHITGALRTTPTKAMFTMLNCLPTVLMAKQVAMFTATRFNALSR